MSNHGFQTLFGIWQEATAFADPLGPAIRPGGLLAVEMRKEPAISFTAVNPYGQETAAETLHAYHRVTIARSLHIDDFDGWLLDAMRTTLPTVQTDTPTPGITRTTRETRIDTGNAFFGMDIQAADGQTVRLQGMTPIKIAFTIEIGRLVGQQVEFLALRTTDIEPADARTANPSPTSAVSPLNCRLKLAAGASQPNPTTAPAFTLSLLFDRDVEPAQFTEEGNPTRAQLKGGWRATGTGTARLPAATAARMRTEAEPLSTLRAEMQSADGLLALAFDAAVIQLRQISALADFVHHAFEFIGTTTTEAPTFTTVTEL